MRTLHGLVAVMLGAGVLLTASPALAAGGAQVTPTTHESGGGCQTLGAATVCRYYSVQSQSVATPSGNYNSHSKFSDTFTVTGSDGTVLESSSGERSFLLHLRDGATQVLRSGSRSQVTYGGQTCTYSYSLRQVKDQVRVDDNTSCTPVSR